MDLKPGKWKLNFRGGKDKWLAGLAVGMIFLILAFPAGGKGGGSRGTGNLTAGNQWAEDGAGQSQGAGTLWGEGGAGQNEGAGNQQASGGLGQNQWAGNQRVYGGVGDNQSSWSLTGSKDGQTAGDETGGETGSGTGDGSGDTRESGAKPASARGTLTYEQQLEERLKELLGHVEGVGQVEVMIVLKSSEEKVWRVDRNTSYSSTQESDANGGTRDIRSQETTEGTILSGQSGGEGPLLEKELRPEVSGVVVSADGGGSPTVQAEISAAVEALFDVPSHKIKVLKRAE